MGGTRSKLRRASTTTPQPERTKRAASTRAKAQVELEAAEQRTSRLGTHDELIRFLRSLAVSDAFAQLMCAGSDVVAKGTLSSGALVLADGQGDHLVAHWDPTGVVVLGFDHIGAGGEWELPLDQRNPGQHLVGVPHALAPLAERATDDGERLATEGLWIAAGEQGASGESMSLEVIPRLTGLGEGCTAREDASALPEPELRMLRAASTGDLEAVKAALAEGANIEVALKNRAMPLYPDGATPLLVAIRSDQREIAEHLLAAGANVDMHIDGGSGPESPLRRAATERLRVRGSHPARRARGRAGAREAPHAPPRRRRAARPCASRRPSGRATRISAARRGRAAPPRRHDRRADPAQRGVEPQPTASPRRSGRDARALDARPEPGPHRRRTRSSRR